MLYILLSFITGVIIVLCMILNGKFAQKQGIINGILLNYVMATVSSIILCIFMINTIPPYINISSVPLLYFCAGFIGVLTTYIFNIIVSKIPAAYLVILRFIGQILASASIDYIYLGVFSKGKVLGAVLFLIGLTINAKVDNASSKESISY